MGKPDMCGRAKHVHASSSLNSAKIALTEADYKHQTANLGSWKQRRSIESVNKANLLAY